MYIRSTKRPSPGPKTRLLTRAVGEGSLRRPALILATADGQPDILVGSRAYRNDRLGDLTRHLTKLSGAAARSLFPKHAPLIDGIAFVIGSAPRVESMLRDGVSPGDFVDLASLVAGGVVHARDVAGPEVLCGTDDGTASAPPRRPDMLDHADAVLGVVAKTRSKVMASGVSPRPFERPMRSAPPPFSDLANAWAPTNPLIGAGFGLLDVLFDSGFWEALDESRKPPPAHFRPSDVGPSGMMAASPEPSGVRP